MAAAFATSASISRPDTGRTWIVISRATSDCHSLAAPTTSTTAPVVSAARKVMIAITATSARPPMVLRGTSGASARRNVPAGQRPVCAMRSAIRVSVIGVHASVVQDQPAGIVLVHQADVVRGDDDGGARLV